MMPQMVVPGKIDNTNFVFMAVQTLQRAGMTQEADQMLKRISPIRNKPQAVLAIMREYIEIVS